MSSRTGNGTTARIDKAAVAVLDALITLPEQLYVVQEHGTDYDDERTNIKDEGSPLRIFKDLQAAQDECARRNLEAFRRVDNLTEYYAFEPGEDDARDQQLRTLLGLANDADEFFVPQGLSDDELRQVMALSGIDFFSVAHVPTQQ